MFWLILILQCGFLAASALWLIERRLCLKAGDEEGARRARLWARTMLETSLLLWGLGVVVGWGRAAP